MTTMKCYAVSLRIAKEKKVAKPKVKLVACTSLNSNLGEVKLYLRKAKPRVVPTEEVKPFQLSKESSQCTKLGCRLVEKSKNP